MDGLVLPALFELLDEVGVLDASTDEEREGERTCRHRRREECCTRGQ